MNFKKRPNKNKVNLVDSDDSDDEDYAFIVNAEKQAVSIPVKIGGVPTDMIIDSGATCNLISRLEWERLKKAKVMCDSRKCTKKLFAYGSKKPLDVAGSFTAEISVGKTSVMTEFIVVEGHGQNLLGKETPLFLNVLRLGPEHVNNVRKVTYWISSVMYSVDLENSRTFSDKIVKPVAQSVRPLPFRIRGKIDKKLQSY